MFARFNKTLSARIVAGALCTMFLALALMVFTASSMLQGQLELLAQERQDSSMRVAWEVLKSKGDRFAIKDGKLVVGDNYVVNDNFEVVDRVKELVGGTATVFQGDMRVSTNVKKPDGSRAVGTPLAKNAAYEAIFQQAKPYRGSADILGTPFYTAYDPILDADGKVIGILYVGLKKSEFLEHVQAARSKLLQIAFGVGLAGALMIAWVAPMKSARSRGRSMRCATLWSSGTVWRRKPHRPHRNCRSSRRTASRNSSRCKAPKPDAGRKSRPPPQSSARNSWRPLPARWSIRSRSPWIG